jgi:hypothetical protein
MKRVSLCSLLASSAVAAVLFVGCAPADAPSDPVTPVATDDPEHDAEEGGHAHGAAPHDGTIADWGGGKYHVEFTVDHAKKSSTVYILGDDAKTPAPLKAADGKLLLSIDEPAFQVDLVAEPLEGEADGAASRYTGTNESLGIVREFSGSISAEVEGTPYVGTFKEEPHGHTHE